MQRIIQITWTIQDMQEIEPGLSDKQASDVLVYLEKNHDANIGINWDVIESAILENSYPQNLWVTL